tara:strand:+ start:12159 stop:13256 length:1098 start_codon:yes stop_codon:yes gene_type:complete
LTEFVDFPNEKAIIIKEACAWLALMDSRNLSDIEKAKLNKWVRANELHKVELERLATIWDNIEAADIDIAAVDQSVEIHKSTTEKRFENSKNSNKSRSRLLISIAASLFLCISVGIGLHFHNIAQFKSTNGKYTTDIGGQQTVLLADGSKIRLNTDTLVEVNYHDGQRNIHLYKGEAHFDVASDPERPFIVKARKGDVLALGTIFSVRVKNDRVNVIVEEGKVRIRANENFDRPISDPLAITDEAIEDNEINTTIVASAGKNVIFGEQEIESIIQEEKEEIERKFSWRQGMLAFDDEPLSDVIEEVSRYTSSKIIIGDPNIRTLRVGGYYPIGKIHAIFDALELNLGLHVKKVDERTYYITYNES